MSESDKVALRRIPLEAINQGRLDVVDEVLAADFIDHDTPAGATPDRDGVKGFITALRSAFPDIHYTTLHEIAEGDMVVQHIRAVGTMTGDFGPMKATGKRAEWNEVHIVRMKDGKGVEHWPLIDQLTMLQQLGVIPETLPQAA